MNTFGHNLRITTFGESHGPAMGGIIDGFPSGFKIDFEKLQLEIDRRRPGTSNFVTQRNEPDVPEFLSGISPEGITLGTPIGFIVRNKDHHSADYSENSQKYRPNHADFTYQTKFGIRDHRGGGRASARETLNWVVAGALAQQWLLQKNIKVTSLLTAVGDLDFSCHIKPKLLYKPFDSKNFELTEKQQKAFVDKILQAKNNGDSISGEVTCFINGVPAGVGSPVFQKLHASLAQAMMSINAAKAFEYGIGSQTTDFSGLEQLDIFYKNKEGEIVTKTNFSGGIQGGISNGMPIYFKVTFKPTPTVKHDLATVDQEGKETVIKMKGRHDPCVAVRAVSVVKAMAALVIADALL